MFLFVCFGLIVFGLLGCYLLDIIVGLAWALWTPLGLHFDQTTTALRLPCYFGFGLDLSLDCILAFLHSFVAIFLFSSCCICFRLGGLQSTTDLPLWWMRSCFHSTRKPQGEQARFFQDKLYAIILDYMKKHAHPCLRSLCLLSAFGIRLMSASTLANVHISVHTPTATRHLPSSATSRPTSVSMMKSSHSCAGFLDAERPLANLETWRWASF